MVSRQTDTFPGGVVTHPCPTPGKTLERKQKPNLHLDVRTASSLMPRDSWFVGSQKPWFSPWPGRCPFTWRGQGLRAGVGGEESMRIRESHPVEPCITELPHVGMRGDCRGERGWCADAGGPRLVRNQRPPR